MSVTTGHRATARTELDQAATYLDAYDRTISKMAENPAESLSIPPWMLALSSIAHSLLAIGESGEPARRPGF